MTAALAAPQPRRLPPKPASAGPPLLLRWDTTLRCNLACLHCCVGDAACREATPELPLEQLQQGLARVAAAGVQGVHLLGGEPTMREDFLDLVAYARGLGLEVSFNTNGVGLTAAFLDQVLALDLLGITVSLDGPDAASHDHVRGQGTFAQATALVADLLDCRASRGGRRPYVQVQSVLMSTWADRAGAMVELVARLGADSLVLTNLMLMGNAVANWRHLAVGPVELFLAMEQVLHAMTRHPLLNVTTPIRLLMMQYFRELTDDESLPLQPRNCPAIAQICNVLVDGTLVPCQLAHDRGLCAGLTPPTVLAGDLTQAWDGPYFARFAELVQGDPAVVYRDQTPCNRCVFLGRGCLPCPITATPGQPPVNHLCLLAEQMLAREPEAGGLASLDLPTRTALLREIVAGSPELFGC